MKYLTKIIFTFLLLSKVIIFAQIDKKATRETKNLFANLIKAQGQGVMLGHQDGLAYGLNSDLTRWIGDNGRSDIKTISGEHPAVLGWDLGKLEFDSLNNIDGVPFTKMRESIQETYARGGVNTISWHFNNPNDPTKNTWSKADSTIKHLFENEQNLKRYCKWLDRVAIFLKSLKGTDGELIPVIFRPFHEHTGSWFWWGAGHCTPTEYKKMWTFTEKYLMKKKKVHHILWAYSTDYFSSKEHYLERYPGDDYIDLLGFDYYHRDAPKSDARFKSEFTRMIRTVNELAQERNKLSAVTEMGLSELTENKWWTDIYSIVKDTKLSYALLWRNGFDKHYYAPFEGQKSTPDFLEMLKKGKILLEKETSKKQLYKSN